METSPTTVPNEVEHEFNSTETDGNSNKQSQENFNTGGLKLDKPANESRNGSSGIEGSVTADKWGRTLDKLDDEETSCVPWWIFFVSIASLTLVYILALISCVYFMNVDQQKHLGRQDDVLHTPTRAYYVDQSSARKRSPPVMSERYVY